jgi:hypothetical protein
MMWCPLMSAHDDDLEDVGVSQVAFVPRIRSFIFSLFFEGLGCDSMGDRFPTRDND